MAEQIRMSEHQSLAVVSSTADELHVEATWRPGTADQPPAPPKVHWHPAQTERFEVLEGELTAMVGDSERVYRVGESFEVTPRTTHSMWNPGTEVCRASWRITPALRTLDMFRTIDRGLNPAQAVLMLAKFRNEFRLGRPKA